MNENYLVINGKKVELTEEQLKALGVAPEKKRKNPFERVTKGRQYYFISGGGNITSCTENTDSYDNDAYCDVNYFNDKDFAEQVNLHQLLYRKLLKFAYDNEREDTAKWDGQHAHWTIRYDNYRNEFCSYYQNGYKAHDVYFSSKDGAVRAIKEVVDPFMKEHPDFVW